MFTFVCGGVVEYCASQDFTRGNSPEMRTTYWVILASTDFWPLQLNYNVEIFIMIENGLSNEGYGKFESYS